MNKNITIAIVVFLAAGLGSFVGVKISQGHLGGLVHNIQETFDAGIAVNSTQVISSSRGASFTTGAFSGALTVTGALTVSGETQTESLIQGGTVVTRLFNQAKTVNQMTAAEACDSAYLMYAIGSTSPVTLYVPNSTQLIADCLASVGKNRSFVIYNYGTTSGAEITITATGTTELKYASSTSAKIPIGGRMTVKMMATNTTDSAVSSSSILFLVAPY